MSEPLLDIIVPVHDARRPVARLASSVLAGTSTPLRLTFVCHGIPSASLGTALGEWRHDLRVRMIEHSDGATGPAGPFLAGLARATAPYVMKIDSDDTVERGAIDAWMKLRQAANADIVICRMRAASAGRDWSTPPARPGRRLHLDPVKDRLAYRTSTMGIIARERMTDAPPNRAVRTGEDIASGLRLWFSGASIALATHEPAYLVHDDGPARATERRPLAEELKWLEAFSADDVLSHLPPRARAAIATKLIRVQLFGAATSRIDELGPDELRRLAAASRQIVVFGSGVPPWLSRADRDLLDALLTGATDQTLLKALLARRRRFGRPVTLLPRSLRWTFHREAPIRAMMAFAWASRRRTRRL